MSICWSHRSTDTQSYAIFGEGTWSIIKEKMSLTAGARWTLDDKDYRECLYRWFMRRYGWTNDLGRNFNEFTPRLILALGAQ